MFNYWLINKVICYLVCVVNMVLLCEKLTSYKIVMLKY